MKNDVIETGEPVKGLFILSRLLGGGTYTQNLVQVVRKIPFITPIFLFLDPEDYKQFSAPKFFRRSTAVETLWVIRKKFEHSEKDLDGNFDFLFFQSIGLIPAFSSLIKRYPTAVAHDSTIILAQKLNYLEKPTLGVKLKGALNRLLFTPYYRKVIPYVDIFLPRTEWCANSLREDFGVPSEKIQVTLPPQDLSIFRPMPGHGQNAKINLLFVGNDFGGKGGEFLLNLYEEYLSDKATLTIVSNDSSLRARKVSAGIEIVQGIIPKDRARLAEIFRTGDVFVFPTRREHLGIVLCEAASSGLALMATDVGGTGEIVRDGFNGYLMPYGSSAEQWATKIRELIVDRDKLGTLKSNSRKLAEEKLSLSTFENTIMNTIKILINNRRKNPA